jgi:crotonobetainyl-CoA:carnitine CoA-transferase CaiB-like acyl-CoA transferase
LRVQNRTILVPLVESLMHTRSTAAWEELLRRAEVPHAPVWSYADLFAQPEMAERLRITVRDPAGKPVDLVASPFHITGADLPKPTPPPTLGQHTDEVLTQLLGLDDKQVAQLRQKGVI